MKVFKVLLIGVLVFAAGCSQEVVVPPEAEIAHTRHIDKLLEYTEGSGGERIEVAFVDNYSQMKLSDVLSECGEIVGNKAELYDYGFVGNPSDVPVVSVETIEGKELEMKWYKANYQLPGDGGDSLPGGKDQLVKEQTVKAQECEDGKFYVADYLEGDDEIVLFGGFYVEIFDGEELISKVNFALSQ